MLTGRAVWEPALGSTSVCAACAVIICHKLLTGIAISVHGHVGLHWRVVLFRYWTGCVSVFLQSRWARLRRYPKPLLHTQHYPLNVHELPINQDKGLPCPHQLCKYGSTFLSHIPGLR